jgi:hypothetical protein
MHIQRHYDPHRDLLELRRLHDIACLPRLSRGGLTTCHLSMREGVNHRNGAHLGAGNLFAPGIATARMERLWNVMKKGLPAGDNLR